MSKRLTILSLLTALALPLAAAAQTQTDTDTGSTAAPDSGISLGQEVGDGSEIGQPYTAEIVGDWELRCIRTESGEDPCQMYQLLKDADGNSVAEVTIFRLPPGGQAEAGATVIAPLETLLTAQMTIAIDGGAAKRYPFAFCNQVGCFSRIGLTADDVSAYKRGARATVTVVPFVAPDQQVNLTMSLTGFTAAYGKTSTAAN